jgi:hypothetical protein
MEISVFLENEYIPEWRGNRESDSPIVFDHKEPSMNLRRRLIPQPKAEFSFGPDGKSTGGQAEMVIDNERIVRGMTTGIRNLTIRKRHSNGTEKTIEIRTVEDLFSDSAPATLGGLIDEMGTYYQKILQQETNTKNSE